MQDSPVDTDSTTAPEPPPSSSARAVRAFGSVFAGVGALGGLALACVLPALVFRADAARDTRVLVGLVLAATWLAAFAAAAVAHASTHPSATPARPLPGRGWVVAFALFPFVTYVLAEHVRDGLVAQEDPLYGYCERALSRALAEPGIAAPTSLAVEDGRLTLAVPAYPARHARWWVDVDADDTVGRRCTFHAAVTFGEDPVVLRIPLPMASREMPARPFGLVPGSMVVVHAVRLALDAPPVPMRVSGTSVYMRRMEMVYEVPAPRGGARPLADFVDQR